VPYRHIDKGPYRHVNNWILDFVGVMAVWEVLGFAGHWEGPRIYDLRFMIDDLL